MNIKKVLMWFMILVFVVGTVAVGFAEEKNSSDEFFKVFEKPNSNTIGSGISETSDGYIIAGSIFDNLNKTNWGWVLKIDKRGNKQWEKEIGKKIRNSELKKIVTMDNEMLLAGLSNVSLREKWQAGTWAVSSGWIVKLKTDGNVIWDKNLRMEKDTSSADDIELYSPVVLVWDAKPTKDGNVIVAGNIRHGLSDTPLFWKLDKEGKILWKKHIDTEKLQSIGINTIYSLQDGGFLVGGYLIDNGKNSSNTLFIRMDNDGNVLWKKEFAYRQKYLRSLAVELDSNSFVLGSVVEDGNKKQPFLWLSSLKTNGSIEWEKKFELPGVCEILNLWMTKNSEIVSVGETCNNEKQRIWVAVFSQNGELKSIKKFLSVEKLNAMYAIPTKDDGFITVGTGADKKGSNSSAWVFKTKLN